MTANISNLVEEFQGLTLEDQESAADIIRKQLLESRREHLAVRSAEAQESYRSGKSKTGSFSDLMKDLEND